jgi:uncharacterized coiled-coil protein SlyX
LNNDNEEEIYGSKVENKLIAHLPKTISSAQLFTLACMLNKPDIEANVHDIDFKYSDYKFHLGKNLDLIQRLHPLCEKFSQTIAHLNQSFAKLDSELDWLQHTNDNETSQKEKELLFNELHANFINNHRTIAEIEGPLSARIIDELNTTHTECDEFIEDLNESVNQVKSKYAKTNESMEAYAEVFEAKKA